MRSDAAASRPIHPPPSPDTAGHLPATPNVQCGLPPRPQRQRREVNPDDDGVDMVAPKDVQAEERFSVVDRKREDTVNYDAGLQSSG